MALTKITSRILDSSGVTILGTITTGVWQGTAINQTYLVGQSGTNTGDETLARINALDVTELGTISSGVWNGTVIASAYLDADTAHLSTTQTFTGAKTFSSNAIFTGNVGIGTASPGAKLHNYSTATTNVFITGYGTAAQNNWQAQNAFFVKTDNGILISKENANNNTNRLFNFYNNASAEASMHMYRGGSTSYIKLDTNGDSYLNGGNVGIGTTSPAHKLSVNQNTYASGSDAPEAALGITIGDYWTTTTGAALTIKNAGHRGAVGHASGSPLFRADFNNAVGMILNKDGNVGIGTASPISGFKLDVQGGDFRVGDDANQGFEAGYSAGSGNVFLQGYNRGTSSFVNMILNNALTISSGGDASFNGNVSLADTKYIQLNNTSTDWQLRADNAGKFIVQTSGGSEFFKIRNNGEIAFGNGTAFNQFFNVRSSSTSQSLINIGTSDNSEFLNVGVFGSAGYVMMENAAALNIGTGGVTRLSISSGGVITTGGSISNPFKITANPGTRSLKLTSASTNFGTFISWLRANETYEKAYLGFTSTSNDVFEINNRENADMTFHTNTTERMRISSGGEYSFGTPSSVTYSHGSNDGFHLRTGLELGFGNGNNNRPDFGINATGSGGGASLNIYCGEGSDDVDIQIAPNAVMQFNSGGIKFGSSGELLDTYEEGSWVVTLPSSSGASITTYRARYTIIGNVCHFQLYVLMGSIPSNGNAFQISLPITPDSTTNDYTGVSMGYCSSFNTNSWLPITHASLAYIYFHRNDGNGAVITNAQASGLPQIILSGHYYI